MVIKKQEAYRYTGKVPSAAPFGGKPVIVHSVGKSCVFVKKMSGGCSGSCTKEFFYKNYVLASPASYYHEEKGGKLLEGEQYVDISTPIKEECDTQHYNFTYTLTEKDLKNGFIRVDPYWVSNQWKLGEKDPSGCAFHILKTLARLFTKKGNTKTREIESIQKTAMRMEDIHG